MKAKRAKTKTSGACGGVTGGVTETPPDGFHRAPKVRLTRNRVIHRNDPSRYESGFIQDRTLAVVLGICVVFLVAMLF